MCLKVKENAQFKIAKKDMPCYKVLIDNGISLLSPYKKFKYVLGQEVRLNSKSVLQVTVDDCTGDFGIAVGLHSFYRLKDAQSEAADWGHQNYKVFRAIIPKGSMYFTGEFDCTEGTFKSYASDAIIITEPVNKGENAKA